MNGIVRGLLNSVGSLLKADDEIVIPALITEDIFHYAVHEKVAFMVTHEATLSSSAEFHISFKTPPVENSLHLLYNFHGDKETLLTIQEGAVVTASTGTQHSAFNRNRLSPIPVTKVLESSTGSYIAGNVELGATITNQGITINGDGQHVGANRDGGAIDASHEFVLAPDTVYVIKVTNHTTNTNIAYLELSWFEVPNA